MRTRHPLSPLLLIVLVCLARPLCAAEPTPGNGTATPTPAGPADDYNRGVPRTAARGFLEACWAPNPQRAANYLDLRRLPPASRAADGPTLADELCTVIDRTVWIDPEQLSEAPDGEHQDSLPSRRDLIGTIQTAAGPVQVLLERVPREDGVLIWKISGETVAKVPALYQEFGYGRLGEVLPRPLVEVRVLQVQLWQWIALFLLAGVAFGVSWVLARLLLRAGRGGARRLGAAVEEDLLRNAAGPLQLTLAVLLFYAGSVALQLSVRSQALVDDGAKILAIAGVTWLLSRCVDLLAHTMATRLMMRRHVALSFVPLGRRSIKVLLVIVGVIATLQTIGLNATSLLAGLGIGGLAVALAAQKTVENLFGSITLVADQPVRVGDYCRFGDRIGKVEDIGLRSTRLRTLDRTVISIPNGEFAAMQIENVSRRDRFWLQATVGLHYDTTPQQLRTVLTELRKAVVSHEKVDSDRARIRFVGFGNASFRVEIHAYIQTSDINEFTGIREEIFLQAADIVGNVGTRFAGP